MTRWPRRSVDYIIIVIEIKISIILRLLPTRLADVVYVCGVQYLYAIGTCTVEKREIPQNSFAERRDLQPRCTNFRWRTNRDDDDDDNNNIVTTNKYADLVDIGSARCVAKNFVFFATLCNYNNIVVNTKQFFFPRPTRKLQTPVVNTFLAFKCFVKQNTW